MHDPTIPAAPPATTPGPPAELTAPPGTALQIAQMLASGRIDTAQVGKLSKAGNISTLQVAQALHVLHGAGEPQDPDVRSPEVKELDKQFPPAKENDYTIRYGGPGEDVPMTPELKQFDANARTWMSTAGMPKDIGNSLVNMIGKVTQQTQHMSDAELEAYGQKEFQKLEKVHGEKLDERLQLAAAMVHDMDMKSPGLKNLLRSKGIRDNAIIANMLISHATIYHERKARGR